MSRQFFLTKRAAAAQEKLSQLGAGEPLPRGAIKTIGGVDVAYSGDVGYAVAVVVEYPSLRVADECEVSRRVRVPYIPTYLGFREAPIMAEVFRRLTVPPDVTLVDGHGVAHPRGFGLACHLGAILDASTVGVAKKRLFGAVSGDTILGEEGEVIGRVVTLKRGKRLFVSVGYKVRLEDAVTLVEDTIQEGTPEPLRLAHIKACETRRKKTH